MVSPDLAEFKERLRDILPREPIEVRTAGAGIVLSGRVSGARKVSRALELAERYAPGQVTNLMMVGGTQQVQLKVRFAEMTRNIAKQLDTSLVVSDVDANLEGISVFGGPGNAEDISGGFPFTIAEGTFGSIGGVFDLGGDLALNLLIEALETKGLVRTLAEPNLVAVSGESASFFAGGEFPIQVFGEDGEIAIEFRDFGIKLDFTPTVIDEDLIRLDLSTEVSALDTATEVAGVPGLSSRTAQTSVEMRDGQSFAIAGLLQDDFTDAIGQIPWLGDVPILGNLFRSTSYSRRQSELVIIITPHLVSPVDGELLALPTDRMRIPTERELFINGSISGSGAVQDVARQDFQGSYGYVME